MEGGGKEGVERSKSDEKSSGRSGGRGPGAVGAGSPVRAAWVVAISAGEVVERGGTGKSKLAGLVGAVRSPPVVVVVVVERRLFRRRGIRLESALLRSGTSDSGLLAG